MSSENHLSINIDGRLMRFDTPKVMGIVNVTPDSFYAGSRTAVASGVAARVETMRAVGADLIDIGGYSSRPGAADVTADEEYARLARGLEAVRRIWPDAVVSVDTFRADVARRCVEEWGVRIINDISGGTLDAEMWPTVASLRVAYVLMHMRGTPQNMVSLTDYRDVAAETLSDLAFKTAQLREMGVSDVIIDPGFGFAKTIDQNYQLLADLREFRLIGAPLLVGVSRKSMIYKVLGIEPEDALNGTTILNAIALLRGADILRVHDVREAVEAVRLTQKLKAVIAETEWSLNS